MSRPRLILLAAALTGIALLALFLRDFVQTVVIPSLARLFWQAGLVYRAIPQVAIWAVLLAVLVSLTAGSFIGRTRREYPGRSFRYQRLGEIQQMAFWLKRSRRSRYSQWQIASRLANIALDILQRRTGTKERGRQLEGLGWQPPADVQEYLSTGLRTTFADYPGSGPFSPQPHTPFDRDIEPVVAYLESLLEDEHDHQHS